jgi:hypothetical protein
VKAYAVCDQSAQKSINQNGFPLLYVIEQFEKPIYREEAFPAKCRAVGVANSVERTSSCFFDVSRWHAQAEPIYKIGFAQPYPLQTVNIIYYGLVSVT